MHPIVPTRVRTLTLAAVCAAVLGAAAAAQPAADSLPQGVRKVTSVEGITEYRLDNGLSVLLFPDPSKQTITVNVTYLVGSKHEGYGETGMAHLLEHMVFKGTPRHPDIPQELTEHGARPNGSTWYDRTNYFETFAAGAENLEWALDLEADRMVNSHVSREDLDSEMTVVRNELEMGENYPQGVLMERMFSTAYLWHNYGKSTIGSRADLENVPIERLQAFYRKHYQPDNAVLVVAGNFAPPATLGLIAETFGAIPRPERVLPAVYTQEPAQDGERTVTLRRVGDLQMVGAAYHVPPGSHRDYAAIDLAAHVLGDTPSGRLYKVLVETGKAAYAYDSTFQLADPGMVMFFADVRKEASLEAARDALLAEVEGLAARPPTAEEVERARESRLTRWETIVRNSERAAILLSEWASRGDWRLMFLYRDWLRQVTPEDVQRVAAAYLRPVNRTLGLYVPTAAPQRVEVPAPPDVAALVAGYAGGEALAAGESFDVTPAAIEALAERSVAGAGLKLVLVPKKTRGEVVQLALHLHFGDLESLRGRAAAADLAGRLLMRGTAAHSRQQIEDELDRLKAQLRVFGAAAGVQAMLEVERRNLEPALRLLAEVLRRPSFPAAELELLKQEQLAQLEDSKSDPFQKAFTTFQRHMQDWPEDDPRYLPTVEEQIARVEKVTLEAVRAFHEGFYGASSGELAAVGDFDAAALRGLAEELFGGWRSAAPYERLSSTYRPVPPLATKIETPDKESAVFVAGEPVKLSDEDPDYPALELADFMTGGGFLSSRLATRLRQQDGLSYGVGSRFNASSFEQDASFMAYAIYAPQNGERLVAAFDEEMRRIVEQGFTAEEIAAAKKGWLQQRRVSRSQERELARNLGQLEYRGRTLAWDAELEAAVDALTPEAIHAAVRRHLDPEKMSKVQAGDFARAGAPAEAGSP